MSHLPFITAIIEFSYQFPRGFPNNKAISNTGRKQVIKLDPLDPRQKWPTKCDLYLPVLRYLYAYTHHNNYNLISREPGSRAVPLSHCVILGHSQLQLNAFQSHSESGAVAYSHTQSASHN